MCVCVLGRKKNTASSFIIILFLSVYGCVVNIHRLESVNCLAGKKNQTKYNGVCERGGRGERLGRLCCVSVWCVWVSGSRRSSCSIRFSCYFSPCSWELLAAAGEERAVPGALHARNEQGRVLSKRTTGDVLDRRGRP